MDKLKAEIRKDFEEKFSNVGWIPESKQRHLAFLDTVIDRTVSETREEINKKTYYTIIDTLTNGNYINGVTACEIADKVLEKLSKP